MKISIIIVNYNVKEYLKNCILSIRKDNIEEKEIIVIDNNSTDGSLEMIKSEFSNSGSNLILIENKENKGFATAVNQGIKEAKGRFIFILNPDTEILKGNISDLIEFLENNEEAVVVGPKLLNSDGSWQSSAYNFPDLLWAFLHLIRIKHWFPKKIQRCFSHFKEPNEIKEVDWVTGAALCIKRKAIEEIGLFDENFFLYFEEIDWCRRASKMGKKVYFYPNLWIIHHLEKSSNKVKEKAALQRYKSMLYYFKKHKGRLVFYTVRFLIIMIFFLRMLKEILFIRFSEVRGYGQIIKMAFSYHPK